MPSTARQLRQPPTIEAIGRVPYFADVVLEVYGQFKRFLLLNIYNERQLDKNSRTQRNSKTTISRAILEREMDLPFIPVGDYNLHYT